MEKETEIVNRKYEQSKTAISSDMKNLSREMELNKYYKQLIQEYAKDNILTTTLALRAQLMQMDFERDSRTELSPTVKKANRELEEVQKQIRVFNKKCWPYIQYTNINSTKRFFQFETEKIQLLTTYTAGRILISISLKNQEDHHYVSIIGTHDKQSKCGFQGICATKNEAVVMLKEVIENWKNSKYIIYTDNDLTII